MVRRRGQRVRTQGAWRRRVSARRRRRTRWEWKEGVHDQHRKHKIASGTEDVYGRRNEKVGARERVEGRLRKGAVRNRHKNNTRRRRRTAGWDNRVLEQQQQQ